MHRLSKLPVIGPYLEELLTPDRVTYRRFGEREDRTRRLRAQGLAFLTGTVGVAYLTWVYSALNWSHPVMSAIFLGAEIACLMLFLVAAAGAWRLRFKPEQAALPSAEGKAVDVFITVCGEPMNVVTQTIAAAARISWGGPLTVYVLDDKGSPEVERVAGRYGAVYRSRVRDGLPPRDAKAGNLNFGLGLSSGDYVLTLDADQVPSPVIVERLAPYLTLPRVAFVQSKQAFLVPDDDPFYSDDLVFYNSLQPAFDANDTVLSCGSGVLYLRAALDEIGGFVTWNLVEDLTTSYELHSRGWKSLYYPYALAVGLAPENLAAVYRQRGQWALDTMRLFFWRSPLTRRTLPWPARLNYAVIGFSYLTAGFVAPLFYLFPLWSYATGEAILAGQEIAFVWWRTVYFLTMTLALRWLFRGQQPGKQFQMLVGLFPVYASNSIRALAYRRRKPEYRVNNRTERHRERPAWMLVLPQLLLLVANAVGPFLALAFGSLSPSLVLANICISGLAIWSLSHVCTAAFHRSAWQAGRHPTQFYAAPIEG
jgi:cellulose synthase (UDP-forming)